MRSGTTADHAERVNDAYDAVRDKWIAERRFRDLVKFILGNWTSGNCVAYMAPLSIALAAEGEVDLHQHLWSRTVERQVEALFHQIAAIAPGRPQYLRLRNLRTDGFVETDSASYANHERAAAFLLQRLVAALDLWADELLSQGLPADEPERIAQSLLRLKRPRIKVNRLPPNKSSKPTPLGSAA